METRGWRSIAGVESGKSGGFRPETQSCRRECTTYAYPSRPEPSPRGKGATPPNRYTITPLAPRPAGGLHPWANIPWNGRCRYRVGCHEVGAMNRAPTHRRGGTTLKPIAHVDGKGWVQAERPRRGLWFGVPPPPPTRPPRPRQASSPRAGGFGVPMRCQEVLVMGSFLPEYWAASPTPALQQLGWDESGAGPRATSWTKGRSLGRSERGNRGKQGRMHNEQLTGNA